MQGLLNIKQLLCFFNEHEPDYIGQMYTVLSCHTHTHILKTKKTHTYIYIYINTYVYMGSGRLGSRPWDGSTWGRNLDAAGHRLPPPGSPPNGMGGSPPLPLWACGPGGLDFLRDPCEIQAKFVSGQDDSTHWVGGGGGGWPRGGRSTARQQSR